MFEPEEVPPPSALERIGSGVKAAAGGGWAGLTGEGLGQVLGLVFKTRGQTFIEDLAHRLKDCEKGQLTVEDVLNNPKFLDAAFRAAIAAGATHQEEKREALRNAVLNSVLPNSPSDDLQQLFIGYVERLTPSHLRVLRLIADANGRQDGRRFSEVLQDHPEVAGSGLVLQACQDLEGLGLILKPSAGRWAFMDVPLTQLTATGIGLTFLHFIRSPPTSSAGGGTV